MKPKPKPKPKFEEEKEEVQEKVEAQNRGGKGPTVGKVKKWSNDQILKSSEFCCRLSRNMGCMWDFLDN